MMNNRTKLQLVLLLGLMLVLSACGAKAAVSNSQSDTPHNSTATTQTVTNSPTPIPTAITIPEITGYQDWKQSATRDALVSALSLKGTVTEGRIEGNSYYNNIQTGNQYYLNQVRDFLGYSFDDPLHIVRYAFADMNDDGQPEAIVELTNGSDGWFKILHVEQGTVYGFSLVYRGFEDPKADGSYISSGGAADNSYQRLSFDGANAKETVLAHSQTSSTGDIRYYIGTKPVLESSFKHYTTERETGADITWYDYTTGKVVSLDD